MIRILEGAFSVLEQFTGIWKRFSHLEEYKTIILAVVFILAVIAGFYLYRFAFSIVFFVVFSTFVTYFLSPVTSWQNTVAVTAVVGVMVSFLLYRADRLGSLVICALVAAALMLRFGCGLIPALIAAVAAIVLTVIFPVHMLCILTSLFGGLGIMDLYGLDPWIGAAICIAGMVFQYFVTRNKTISGKRYPDRIRYYLEKRKRNEKHIPQGN